MNESIIDDVIMAYRRGGVPHELLSNIEIAASVDSSFLRARLPDGGATWLHMAASVHAHELIRILINCGADPNAANNMLETPLGYIDRLYSDLDETPRAIRCVEILLTSGANPNPRSDYGATLLYRMVKCSYEKCAAILERFGAEVDLATAILRGQRDVVESLVKRPGWRLDLRQAPFLAQDVLDMSLYADSGTTNQGDIVNMLVDSGLSPDVVPADTHCPMLVVAVYNSHSLALVESLLRRGANVNAICLDSGLTALDKAQQLGSPAAITSVLEAYGAKTAKELS